jgi:hypothetical protein
MSEVLDRPYCTLEQLQRFMGDTNANHVDGLIDAINQASRYIDRKTRWIFYRKDYANAIVLNTQGAPGNWTIWPSCINVRRGFIKAPYKPILPGLQIISQVSPNGAQAVLTEGQDYEVDYENGKIYTLRAEWSMRPESYLITGSVGVDNGSGTPYDPTFPATFAQGMDGDITRLCKIIAATNSGYWIKKVQTNGSMQPQTAVINKLDKDTNEELNWWVVRA